MGIGQLLVMLRLFFQRVVQRMHSSGLLGEQQDEGEQQRKKYGA